MTNEIQELKFQVGEAWKGVYSPSTAYGLANVVQDPTGLSIYRSLKSGNVGHPLSNASWWFRIIDLSSIKAESDRIAALNQAIAQDEALRVAAEELRQQHEAERVAAETQRNEAEQQRISAEQARVNAESARATAEQQRITAEQGRVSAESARVQAEQARVLAETLRANAEDQRAANEQNRVAAEQQRIERAEQDHQLAESDHATYVDSLGAFDISAYHATGGVLATYANLQAALGTNGANIPDALRKGGMSVKFVQSSDNKYVQYRLMSSSFNTTVSNWQGVDDGPTVGSENLVKSGGVYPIQTQAAEAQTKLPPSYNELLYSTVANKRLGQDASGNVVYIDADGETVVEFDVIEGRILTFYPGVNFGSSGLHRALWCQNNKVIETVENWTTIEQTGRWNVVVPTGCNKFRAGTGTSTLANIKVYLEGFDNVPANTMVDKCVVKTIEITNSILTDGKYYNADTGVVSDSPNNFMSTWIDISGHLDNSYLYLMTWFSNSYGIGFYNKNKQRISGISGTNAAGKGLVTMTCMYQAIPVPQNAAYIIFGAALNRKSLFVGTKIRFADYSELLAVRSYSPALYGSYFKGVPFFMNANCMELNALYFNSLKFNQKLFDSRCRVPSNFSHDSTLVISEQGNAYIVACCNENGSGDNPYYSDAYVALFSCDAATYTPSTTMSKKVVAKNGDSVDSLTIALGAGVPNVRIISSTALRIIFSAKLSDNNWYLLYRDYDISNDSFGNIGICQIEDENNVSHDFTINYINNNIIELQNQDVFISLNGTIGHDGTTYYCGMCATNQIASSLIFSSNDLLTYKLWLKPSFTNQCLANCEASSFVDGSTMFYAVRQYAGNVMLLAKINMTNKAITEELVIPDAMARPCFYSDGSVLYLAHSMDNRNYTDFVVINKNSLINSHIVLQTAIQTAYPCCVKFGNNIYMTGTSNSYVYLRKFDNNRDSINVVNGKMMSLYNSISIEN